MSFDTKEEQGKLLRSTTTVAVFAGLGVMSGFILDATVAAKFGMGQDTDAFFAAYTVPFLLSSTLFVACQPALVPVFARQSVDHAADPSKLLSTLINLSFVALTPVSLAGIVLAPWIIALITPGLLASTAALAIPLTRILFLIVLLAGPMEVIRSYLYAHQIFTVPAATNLVRNATTFLVILGGAGRWGITAVAVGYVAGVVTALTALCIVLTRSSSFRHHFVCDLSYPELRSAGRLFLASLSGLTLRQGVNIAERVIGSFLPSGSITALSYANRIVSAIAGVLLSSITSAVLPSFSRSIAAEGMSRSRAVLMAALRLASLVSVPVSVFLMLTGVPFVGVLLGRGAFDQHATLLTGSILRLYAVSLLFLGHLRLIQSYFYAVLDARKTVFLFLCVTISTVALDLLLVQPLGVQGLALAFSVGSGVALVVGYYLLIRKLGRFEWRPWGIHNLKIGVATLGMAAVLQALTRMPLVLAGSSSDIEPLMVFGLATVGAMIAFLVATRLLGIEEWELVRNSFKARLHRRTARRV